MTLKLQRIGGASMSCCCVQVLTKLIHCALKVFEFSPLELQYSLVVNISLQIQLFFMIDLFVFLGSNCTICILVLFTRGRLAHLVSFIRVLVCLKWMWKPLTFSLILPQLVPNS